MSRISHVAFFMPTLEQGGAEGVIVTIANQIASLGYNVDIVVCEARGPLISEIEQGVKVRSLGASRVALSPIKLASYILTNRPDVILSTLVHCNVIAAYVSNYVAPNVNLILREANTISKTKSSAQTVSEWTVNALIPSAYARADAIITVSESAASDLSKCLPVNNDEIFTVYNPVDIRNIMKQSDRPVEHKWLNSDSTDVLISVGRLVKQKDHKTLLDALKKLKKSSDVKLIILGDGPERQKLKDYAKKLNIKNSVDFMGFVSNPYPHMKHSDVFVLSSAWEGMPNAMIEAFVLGLPIVATDCPSGPSEILENGRWGELAEVGNPQNLCDCIDQALNIDDDNEKRRQDRPVNRFDVDRIAKEYESVICSVGTQTPTT